MKYSLMSLMVMDELRQEKTSFIISGLLRSMGVADVPADADGAYALLNERGMPMKNGTATFEDLVRFTKEHGFDGLDMMDFQMELPGKEIRSILEKYGVTLSAVNIIAPMGEVETEEEYQAAIRDVYASLDKAAESGAKNILFVPAGYILKEGMTQEMVYQKMIRGLKDAVAYGSRLGLQLSTETLESCGIPMNSIGHMKRIFDDIPDLKYTHDSGNPIIANEDPLEMYRQFSNRVISVHFKDLGVNEKAPQKYRCINGREVAIVSMGTGMIDFKGHIDALKANGYEGFITIEGGIASENKWQEALLALDYLRALEA